MMIRHSLTTTANSRVAAAAAGGAAIASGYFFTTTDNNDYHQREDNKQQPRQPKHQVTDRHHLQCQKKNQQGGGRLTFQQGVASTTATSPPILLATAATTSDSSSGGSSFIQSFISSGFKKSDSTPPSSPTPPPTPSSSTTRHGTSTTPGIKRLSTIEKLQQTATTSMTVQQKYNADWNNPIGRGIFGDVFMGVNKKTKERVAIKKISKKFTNDASFQREMDNLLYLEKIPGAGHPSICFMREHFDSGDFFYLVLDYIEGGELFDSLIREGAYSERDAARVIRQTAWALAFLHGIGLVHTDLKPENLMLSSKDKKTATVKIVDFGCAHLLNEDENHTEHRGTGLTPGYCPPEVLIKKMNDPHSHCDISPSFDMWSLGVIMYVMLTGTHPFDLENNSSNFDMEYKIVDYDSKLPIRNCQYTQHLSEDAIGLLEQLMDRDPIRRLSADELLQHPWVKGETASSTIISGSDRRLKTYLKHQTKVGSTIFKGLLSNSDKHSGSQTSKRISVLEMAFRDLDPKNRGYISTKELNGVTSFLAADAKLSLNELQHLLKGSMTPLHYPKGHVIYNEGENGDSMYFLQSGSVEVTSQRDGFKTNRQSGDFFGEDVLTGSTGSGGSSTVGGNKRYLHTSTCVTPVHVLKISRETYLKYLQHDEEVEMTMVETDRKRTRERAKVIFGLQTSLKPKTYEPGEVIFREGSNGDDLYILEKGKVNISVDGRKVRSLRIGEMTGEHAAFYANKAYNVTAQCVSGADGCTMQILDGNEIRKMCQNNPDLNKSFRDIILRRDFKKSLVKATKRDFPETELELRQAFDTIDSNHSGKIEFDTLREAVLNWDSTYTESDIQDMLKSLDIKNQGHLTWMEFKRIFSMFNDM